MHGLCVGCVAFILLNFAFTMLRSKVDFDLKALQRECLKIMDVFDAVCRAHGLRYYMACGTMLGAVRHKGFIPWDDDVDLYMPRPDYDTLCRHSTEWLPAGMKLCNQDTDITFPHYYGKVEDTGTTFVERSYLGHYSGAWIDIFPIDGAPGDAAERKRHIRRFRRWRRMQYYVYRDPWKHGHNMGGALVWLVQKLYSKSYVNGRLQKVVREYSFDGHDLLMPHNDKQKTFTKETLGVKPVEYEFEGRMFYGMKDYDKYLTTIFGDYMTPPPEDKRVVHHSIECCDLNLPIAEYIERIGK